MSSGAAKRAPRSSVPSPPIVTSRSASPRVTPPLAKPQSAVLPRVERDRETRLARDLGDPGRGCAGIRAPIAVQRDDAPRRRDAFGGRGRNFDAHAGAPPPGARPSAARVVRSPLPGRARGARAARTKRMEEAARRFRPRPDRSGERHACGRPRTGAAGAASSASRRPAPAGCAHRRVRAATPPCPSVAARFELRLGRERDDRSVLAQIGLGAGEDRPQRDERRIATIASIRRRKARASGRGREVDALHCTWPRGCWPRQPPPPSCP